MGTTRELNRKGIMSFSNNLSGPKLNTAIRPTKIPKNLNVEKINSTFDFLNPPVKNGARPPHKTIARV